MASNLLAMAMNVGRGHSLSCLEDLGWTMQTGRVRCGVPGAPHRRGRPHQLVRDLAVPAAAEVPNRNPTHRGPCSATHELGRSERGKRVLVDF